jgi:hypothetical protein
MCFNHHPVLLSVLGPWQGPVLNMPGFQREDGDGAGNDDRDSDSD